MRYAKLWLILASEACKWAKMGLKGLKIGVLWSYYMTGFESVL